MKIAIVGLGLIGGSMGLALRRSSENLEIVGYARREDVATRAVQLGVVDRTERDLVNVVKGAELVFIATPVMAIRGILQEIGLCLKEGCIVTDAASTKAQVMRWAEEQLPWGISFIGGHPMAGKETSGIEAAHADLFTGCTYCLVPGRGATKEAGERVEELVRWVGASPVCIDAAEHDLLVAAISHLPILVSSALVRVATRSPQWSKMAELAATGFRDVTRLASGSPAMSRDICLTNREPILRWLDEYISDLGTLRRLVAEGGSELEDAFVRAKEQRESWLGLLRDRGAG